ncbi:Uncharacterised protein [Burkholderia pseudomallei]|nr:Uncharacterised protein [Burkholderia pseudomallei]
MDMVMLQGTKGAYTIPDGAMTCPRVGKRKVDERVD